MDEDRTLSAKLKAKYRGLIARRRLGLAAAIALVVLVAGVALVAGGQWRVEPSPEEQRARLFELAREGEISGAEAIVLARFVRTSALGADATLSNPLTADETVTRAELEFSAGASLESAAAALLQHPDARVREAVLDASAASERARAIETLLELAREGGASSPTIWRACGALMIVGGDDRAVRTLERARALNPQDKALWRMLSYGHAAKGRSRDATGASLVAAGLEAAAASDWINATLRFERALPFIADVQARAFVLGQLGDAAAAREDWPAAERQYRAALSLHGRQRDLAAISLESAKLARAQMKQGEDRRACGTLTRARQQGAAIAESELLQACAAPGLRPRALVAAPG
jgi:tetratricopeptide (TPR) repeat protein